jgi:hypothetical protein
MYYAYKYRLKPSNAHREELDRHRDICRQLYNPRSIVSTSTERTAANPRSRVTVSPPKTACCA